MWTCESCGAQAIAGDLTVCPGCGDARGTEVSSADHDDEQPYATGGVVMSSPVLVGESGPEEIVAPPIVTDTEHAAPDDDSEGGDVDG